MNLQRIKHILLRLSTEEKVLGLGALTIIISSFLPWYSVIISYNERMTTESGFTGDLGVMGFVVCLLTSLAILFLISDHIHFKIPKFGYKKEQILLFLMGESAFLLLLAIAIYTKRSLDYTNAELRFGLYFSLIGSFMGVFSAYSQSQKNKRKEAEEFFGSEVDINPDPEKKIKHVTEIKEVKKDEKTEKHTNHKTEQKSFFYNENSEKENKEESQFTNEDINGSSDFLDEKISDNTIVDESIEDKEDEELIEIQDDKSIPENLDEFLSEEPQEDRPTDQSSYFMKEAGVAKSPAIKVNTDTIKTIEKKSDEPKDVEKKADNEKMGFYDDL